MNFGMGAMKNCEYIATASNGLFSDPAIYFDIFGKFLASFSFL